MLHFDVPYDSRCLSVDVWSMARSTWVLSLHIRSNLEQSYLLPGAEVKFLTHYAWCLNFICITIYVFQSNQVIVPPEEL